MTTYTQNNTFKVVWETECDELFELDHNDKWFETYDEARDWVQKEFIDDPEEHDNTYWVIVDYTTHKIIDSNYKQVYDDYLKCKDDDFKDECFEEAITAFFYNQEKQIKEEGEDKEE